MDIGDGKASRADGAPIAVRLARTAGHRAMKAQP
jgi:hypothetical protein